MGTTFELSYSESALKFLESLPKKQARQIRGKIERLKSDPEPPGSTQLDNVMDGNEPVRRIRQGDYRVLYCIREPIIHILDIGHRKDVYR